MRRLIAILVLSLGLAACGGGGSSDGGSDSISTSPLSGTVNGAPWTAGYAIAQDQGAGDGTYFVTVLAQGADGGCDSFAEEGAPELLASVPWTANSGYDLDLQHNFTFSFTDASGISQNDVATSGRIELDAAPTAPDGGSATTTMRFKGSFDSNNTVEGQVNVLVCPSF